MRIRYTLVAVLLAMALGTACGSSADGPDLIAAVAQEDNSVAPPTTLPAPRTTVAATTSAAPTTTEPATTSEAPPDEAEHEIAKAERFLELVRAGDPELAEWMTPEERDQNIFGLTFAQFLVSGWRFNEQLIDGECAYMDEVVICEWTSTDDFSDAVGFTIYSRVAMEFEGDLVSDFDIRFNSGGVYGAMNRWRREKYPEEKACDPDPNDPEYDGMPPGALESPEGEPIGQECAALMVRLAPEFALSDSYIPPPESAE